MCLAGHADAIRFRRPKTVPRFFSENISSPPANPIEKPNATPAVRSRRHFRRTAASTVLTVPRRPSTTVRIRTGAISKTDRARPATTEKATTTTLNAADSDAKPENGIVVLRRSCSFRDVARGFWRFPPPHRHRHERSTIGSSPSSLCFSKRSTRNADSAVVRSTKDTTTHFFTDFYLVTLGTLKTNSVKHRGWFLICTRLLQVTKRLDGKNFETIYFV